MNFVAGILIVIACTYIGIGIDGYYKMKIAILEEFVDFIGFASAEISFMKTDIAALLDKYATKKSRLSEALSTVKNPAELHQSNLNLAWLTAEERLLITEFIKGVTALDTGSQKGYAEQHKIRASEYVTALGRQRETKGKLAKKLAPLVGLGIMIIIL